MITLVGQLDLAVQVVAVAGLCAEILHRMSERSRLIAIDTSSAMLDVVRRKVAELGSLGKRGVYFRTESAVPKLSRTQHRMLFHKKMVEAKVTVQVAGKPMGR